MHECEFECGRYVTKDERFCETCMQDIESDFSKWLHQKFSQEEIDAINVIFDGRELA